MRLTLNSKSKPSMIELTSFGKKSSTNTLSSRLPIAFGLTFLTYRLNCSKFFSRHLICFSTSASRNFEKAVGSMLHEPASSLF